MMMLVSAGGVLTLALLAATWSGARGAQASGPPAPAHASGAAVASRFATPANSGVGLAAPVAPTTPSCQPVAQPQGYVNPLARARVTPERIDQGVDYAGSGTLAAIGPGTVTYVATGGTGWPGAFIAYRLTDGADNGCYVFYAEGVSPAPGLHVGDTVRAGQAIANIIRGYSTGIELGWAAGSGTKSYAAKMGRWTVHDDADNVASDAGRSFSALIALLGGPPGKMEG
jgi:hypothetical protein